jgi:hypothetical protein
MDIPPAESFAAAAANGITTNRISPPRTHPHRLIESSIKRKAYDTSALAGKSATG